MRGVNSADRGGHREQAELAKGIALQNRRFLRVCQVLKFAKCGLKTI